MTLPVVVLRQRKRTTNGVERLIGVVVVRMRGLSADESRALLERLERRKCKTIEAARVEVQALGFAVEVEP